MPVIEVITRTQTKRYPFTGKKFIFGRGQDVDAVITDDTLISRHHCEVVKYNGDYLLHDLKSRNGTRVLGKPIEAVKLIDTGVFQLGNTYVRFFFTQASANATPMANHPGTTAARPAVPRARTAGPPPSAETLLATSSISNISDDDIIYDVAELVDQEDQVEQVERVKQVKQKDHHKNHNATPDAIELVDEDEDRNASSAAIVLDDGSTPTPATTTGTPVSMGGGASNMGALGRIGSEPGFGIERLSLIDARGKTVHAAGTQLSDANEALGHLQLLCLGAMRCAASDIHLEPRQNIAAVRLRVDGAMLEVCSLTADQARRLMSMIKVLCNIDISRKSVIQEGHFSLETPNRNIDYRVSFAPAMYGQKMVIRVLDPLSSPQQLKDLDMPANVEAALSDIAQSATGMLLVCGPTGSGKTTTLYAALRDIDATTRNVITIEDPIEYEIHGVTQIPVDTAEGHTFGVLLRTCLRQDPDVIVLGEVRDQDTAVTAMQAATTGHLVFSTLHATDTVSTILRLLDLGVEPYLISSTLNIVLAQRLLRRLCTACSHTVEATDEQRKALGLTDQDDAVLIHDPVGCEQCFDTGYAGRVGVFELLVTDDVLRDMILGKPNLADLRNSLISRGFKTLSDHAAQRVLAGICSFEDANRIVGFS
ncbi:MAG: ATPase, T2SS/T4P/T4SS family [Algisphaera sp.]